VSGLEDDASGGMTQHGPPLDLALIALEGPGSLVAVAREGRLKRASLRVGLCPVDEAALALVDRALQRRRRIAIVYPAPAGEVSVLLAAQILIRRFLQGERSQSVGLVTADTTGASRVWDELAIGSPGNTVPIREVFPASRARPDGESPLGRRPFRGVLIGRQYKEWPVDLLVIDHLCGPVQATAHLPAVRVFADALDPELERLASQGEMVWGWNEGHLRLLGGEACDLPAAPFSVAGERLRAMAAGVETTIHVVRQDDIERAVRRLRDDLRTLHDFAGPRAAVGVSRGIAVAWQHVSTLLSLPCRPSAFDRFAGLPPIAALATSTFEPEIAAWARTLTGDLREVAEVLAADLGDLRAALEESDPFARELAQAVAADEETLVVVRTRTAARALIHSLAGDPDSDRVGSAHVVWMRRLHQQGTWSRALVVGTPARWEWHRLDSGLSRELHVLVLGDLDAYLARSALEALQRARERWGGVELRRRTWRELVGTEPPSSPEPPDVPRRIVVVGALLSEPEVDPFEELRPLLDSAPLRVADEGLEDRVAEQLPDGEWRGAVEAVEVVTDAGTFYLPRERVVEVREDEDISERRAGALQPGMIVLVGRREGRVGLLEALTDRLAKQRPDLLAAHLLTQDLRRAVHHAFRASAMTTAELYERLKALGFDKTYHAARGYVDDEGPLAPRDFEDLRRLAGVLGLGVSAPRLREVYAGVRRWRGFRRAAGRALAQASRAAAVAEDETRIDPETGLSIADLREAVLEARVLEVRQCAAPVPVAEIGYLRARAT
jgi:hypothetical protein